MTVTLREDIRTPNEPHIEPPRGRAAKLRFFLPISGVMVGATVLMLVVNTETRLDLLKFAAVYFMPGGIDFAVPIGVAVGLTPLFIVLVALYFDSWITLFWIWNLDHLTRFARISRMVEKSRARADKVWAKHTWLRVASGWGLALFIFIPLVGTGSFTGIIAGKLIELPTRTIWLASVLGTAVRVSILGFGTDALL